MSCDTEIVLKRAVSRYLLYSKGAVSRYLVIGQLATQDATT